MIRMLGTNDVGLLSTTSELPWNDLEALEVFYLNPTLNFGIPPVLVFQKEVYYKVDHEITKYGIHSFTEIMLAVGKELTYR